MSLIIATHCTKEKAVRLLCVCVRVRASGLHMHVFLC